MSASVGSSGAEDELLDHICAIMRENETFVRTHAEETYREVVGLANDGIDCVQLALVRMGTPEEYTRRAMAYFINHVLAPGGYAVYVDLLTCNLPACFAELRLMLETLTESYLADLYFPEHDCYQERMEALKGEHSISTAKRLKELGKQLGRPRDFVRLWGKLSRGWLHASGVMGRVVRQIVATSDVPAWALIVPAPYSEADLDGLDELRKRIRCFRDLLEAAVQAYDRALLSGEAS